MTVKNYNALQYQPLFFSQQYSKLVKGLYFDKQYPSPVQLLKRQVQMNQSFAEH